ncbi:MAG: hypothetical protein ACE5NJ_00130 [Thermodesulfobacteriota bacterium]
MEDDFTPTRRTVAIKIVVKPHKRSMDLWPYPAIDEDPFNRLNRGHPYFFAGLFGPITTSWVTLQDVHIDGTLPLWEGPKRFLYLMSPDHHERALGLKHYPQQERIEITDSSPEVITSRGIRRRYCIPVKDTDFIRSLKESSDETITCKGIKLVIHPRKKVIRVYPFNKVGTSALPEKKPHFEDPSSPLSTSLVFFRNVRLSGSLPIDTEFRGRTLFLMASDKDLVIYFKEDNPLVICNP